MNPGKERILNILREAADYISIRDLASLTGTGNRSVFRYISELKYTLSRYGMDIESKYGKGVRLTGYHENMDKFPLFHGTNSFSGLSAQQRQFAEVILLCTVCETVKLGSIATIFGVSDSCISLDLSNIEKNLLNRPELCRLTLHRRPGEGTYIEGAFWYVRMALLYCSINMYPGTTLAEDLANKSADSQRLGQLAAVLGFHVSQSVIRTSIAIAEKLLACSFTMFDYTLLYCYLFYAFSQPAHSIDFSKRCRKNICRFCGIESDTEPAVPHEIAVRILQPVLADNLTEIYMLQCFLSALEPVRQSGKVFNHPKILFLMSEMERALITENCIREPFGKELSVSLQILLNSIIYRKGYGIPVNVRDYSGSVPVSKTLNCLVSALNPLVKKIFGIRFDLQDLEPLRISIRAASALPVVPSPELRVLVLCYEGICLSRLVASDIHVHFPAIDIVDITGVVTLSEDYLAERHIDLLVTTAKIDIDTGTIACFRIPLPYRRDMFLSAFRTYLETHFQQKNNFTEMKKEYPSIQKNTWSSIHKVFSAFRIVEIEKPIRRHRITAELAKIIGKNNAEYRELKKAFDLRERKGHIYLEIANIQLFHCRSSVLHSAQAGLIRSRPPVSVILYLAAPERATKDELFALSLISSALIESEEFPEALREKSVSQIESQLLQLIS